MTVPSYDDLTPGISDVHPRDTFDAAARYVDACTRKGSSLEPVAKASRAEAAGGTCRAEAEGEGGLFAALRSAGVARPGAVTALAREFSPRIEREGDEAVVLDVSGLGRLLGDAHGISAALARTASDRGIKVRIAVAPTMTAARLLTLQATEPVVVTHDVAAALAPLPLATLKALITPDPSSRTTRDPVFDTLLRWGLRTIGELAALPADEITARFGARGLAIHRLACGLDPRPLIPDPGVPRFIESMELEWPIDALEPLSFVLARLLDPLEQALARADKGGAAIRLDLRLVDRTVHTRQLQLPAPMRDARVLRTLLLLDLESHPPSAGIDVVTIEIDPAPGRIVQFSLLERATPAPETLATLTARLSALVGESRCGSAVLLDTHRPDAFEMQPFNPSRTFGPRDPRTQGPTDLRTQGPTDLRTQGPSFRRFRPPVAIRVAIERGRPMHVPIDRKGMPGGRVVQAAGPWRSSGDWWDTDGRRWDRDEWDVEFVDGTVCRLFQARDTAQWFLDGVID